jgi:hypothetical protein
MVGRGDAQRASGSFPQLVQRGKAGIDLLQRGAYRAQQALAGLGSRSPSRASRLRRVWLRADCDTPS